MNLAKKNILANYIGQIYVMSISIIVMPLYLQYMGAEAYGLVGFFIIFQPENPWSLDRGMNGGHG